MLVWVVLVPERSECGLRIELFVLGSWSIGSILARYKRATMIKKGFTVDIDTGLQQYADAFLIGKAEQASSAI